MCAGRRAVLGEVGAEERGAAAELPQPRCGALAAAPSSSSGVATAALASAGWASAQVDGTRIPCHSDGGPHCQIGTGTFKVNAHC